MLTEPVVLQGSLVRLEPLAPAHQDALCQIGLDPALWERTTIRVQTRDEMTAYIDHALAAQRAGTALPFAISLRHSGTIVGTTRYHTIVSAHRRLNIGFTWIAPRWQRTGVNVEAKYLMLRHAFEEWACERVEFTADAANDVSHRAILSLGATAEGVLRRYIVSAHAGVRDLAVFSIVSPEWPGVKTRLEQRLARAAGAIRRTDPPSPA